ncbi:MAG: type II toxin-antitoxin system VapC family toxin [Bryobacteraceae bacterium]
MNLLLDTHTFIWATTTPARLSSRAKSLLSDQRNRLQLSTASIWEISLKHSLQRKSFHFPEDSVLRGIESLACEVLPVESRHVLALFRLPMLHRDPFDRILIAQAWIDNLMLITTDERVKQYPDIETAW